LRTQQSFSQSRNSKHFTIDHVHYRNHNTPLLISILSQGNRYKPPSYFSRFISISFSYLRLGLHSCLFPSVFPTRILHALILSHLCYMFCLPRHSSLDNFNKVRRGVQDTNLLILQFSPHEAYAHMYMCVCGFFRASWRRSIYVGLCAQVFLFFTCGPVFLQANDRASVPFFMALQLVKIKVKVKLSLCLSN
jgi:hypothetical protein